MNQIIKSTLYKLLRSEFLDEKRIKQDISRLYHKFNEIDLIEINGTLFSKVKIHRNNWQYGLLISICKLFHEKLILGTSNRIMIKTLNLNKNWKEIEKRLLNIIKTVTEKGIKSNKV